MKTVAAVILVVLFIVAINYFTGCGGIVSCAPKEESARGGDPLHTLVISPDSSPTTLA